MPNPRSAELPNHPLRTGTSKASGFATCGSDQVKPRRGTASQLPGTPFSSRSPRSYKLDARSRHQRWHGTRTRISAGPARADTRADVHSHSADVVARSSISPVWMPARTSMSKPFRFSRLPSALCAAGAVEGGNEPVASGLTSRPRKRAIWLRTLWSWRSSNSRQVGPRVGSPSVEPTMSVNKTVARMRSIPPPRGARRRMRRSLLTKLLGVAAQWGNPSRATRRVAHRGYGFQVVVRAPSQHGSRVRSAVMTSVGTWIAPSTERTSFVYRPPGSMRCAGEPAWRRLRAIHHEKRVIVRSARISPARISRAYSTCPSLSSSRRCSAWKSSASRRMDSPAP